MYFSIIEKGLQEIIWWLLKLSIDENAIAMVELVIESFIIKTYWTSLFDPYWENIGLALFFFFCKFIKDAFGAQSINYQIKNKYK